MSPFKLKGQQNRTAGDGCFAQPVTLLDRLAVDQTTVDVRSEEAARVYDHYGLNSLQSQPRRLFGPGATVAKLLGD